VLASMRGVSSYSRVTPNWSFDGTVINATE